MKFIYKQNLPRSRPARAQHYAAARWEDDVQDGFLRSLRAARRAMDTKAVSRAVALNRPDIAVQQMPWPEFKQALERHVLPSLTNALYDGGNAAAKSLESRFGKIDPEIVLGALGPSFSLTNPRVRMWMAAHAARLVTFVSNQTMLAIREILTVAQLRGWGVNRITAELKRNIGLSQPQADALERFRTTLTEQGFTQDRTNQQVNEYRQRLIKNRAKVIARHETMMASNAGQQEIWRQAVEEGLLDPGQKRKWVTQPPINARNPCPVCRPMEGQLRGMEENFVSPHNNDQVLHPPIHIQCLAADTLVTPRGRIHAATKRWVNDDLVVIQCADSLPLTCTSNHPILTRDGWVPAGLLDVGDEVANPGFREGVGLGDGHDIDTPALAEDIAEAFFARRSVVTREVPTSTPDFHGDGWQSKVTVVGADSLLLDWCEALCDECVEKLDFFGGPDPIAFGQSLRMGAGKVQAGDLVFRQLDSAHRRWYSGWVYNFQTDLNYYIAGGYATHNCECVMVLDL